MAAVKVTDSNFQEEVLDAEIPVLVDFWAVWCGPCRAIAPIIEKLADDYAGRAKIAKCDVDNNMQTPMKYGIRSIPTLLFFVDGEVRDQVVGGVAEQELTKRLDALVGQTA